MAVRVKVRLRNKLSGEEVRTVAVANAGYETLEPEATLPLGAAKALNLWPSLPEGTRAEEYRTVAGVIKLLRTPRCLEVELEGRRAVCRATISEVEEEVILSDKLCDELHIALEEPGKGRWRLRNETELRESEEPEYW